MNIFIIIWSIIGFLSLFAVPALEHKNPNVIINLSKLQILILMVLMGPLAWICFIFDGIIFGIGYLFFTYPVLYKKPTKLFNAFIQFLKWCVWPITAFWKWAGTIG